MSKLETPPDVADELLMRQYLLGELSEADSDLLEERFADDQTVFELALIIENELIDSYILTRMPQSERRLFEQNYLKTAEKREKVEAARTLQKYLQNAKAETRDAPTKSVWDKVSQLLAAPAPAWRYATAALVILFALCGGLWLNDRSRLNDRIAELQNRSDSNPSENRLNAELTAVRQRETELQNRLNEKDAQSESLTGELDNERKIRERLEDEIEKIRRSNQSPRNNPLAPELAAVTLRPAPREGEVTTSTPRHQSIIVAKNVEDLSVRLILPRAVKNDERLTAEFNQSPIATNLAPRLEANGTKTLRFVLSARKISLGLSGQSSLITVKNSEKKVISEYPIEFKTQP